MCLLAIATYLGLHVNLGDPSTLSLMSASVTLVAVVAAIIGWVASLWMSYRNARMQHTINLVSTRFTQATFVSAYSAFHQKFGFLQTPQVTKADVDALDGSADLQDKACGQAVRFILNYYEFIAFGVRSGDLDIRVIAKTLRSNLKFYYDKCAPYISTLQQTSPTAMEHYSMLCDHFREPPV